jgi:hypothetical protein
VEERADVGQELLEGAVEVLSVGPDLEERLTCRGGVGLRGLGRGAQSPPRSVFTRAPGS